MDKEKNFDAGANQPQEKSSDERLNEKELANVAGGNFSFPKFFPNIPTEQYGDGAVTGINSGK